MLKEITRHVCVRACASERVSMWVLVFACAYFQCFCGFGIGVLTHRGWHEDSSSGCGFHEVSFILCDFIHVYFQQSDNQ